MHLSQSDFRSFIRASPFKPFRLHLADGKSLNVAHPDFALPGIEQLVVASELPQGVPGELNIIPYEQIVRVEFVTRKPRKAA